MRLFIAEKPSLGKAIAQYLPVRGSYRGPQGKPPAYIEAGNDVVVWCYGHMLEMCEPEAYREDWKLWKVETLPMVPAEWRLEEKEGAKAQIRVIASLLLKADEIVHAGDPDREGQLLVDELLEHLGNKKPVRRIWLPALDESSVRKALGNLHDNAYYQGLKASAEARQRGDWLWGMNLTRAYTLAGQQSGYDGVLSYGRVQTPTLALVVNRDLAIENFQSKDFYAVTATIAGGGVTFSARWRPAEHIPLDEGGRVLDRSLAERVVKTVFGRVGTVVEYVTDEKAQAAPLPYSLSALQAAASKAYGFGAQDVLDLAQELYEAKYTTYPRTDCRYLPESQHGAAAKVLAGLPDTFSTLASRSDVRIKSPVWNDKKITAHHAIIPTGVKPAELTDPQAKIYELIARSYLAQFYPPHTYQQTIITVEVEGEIFCTTGKTPINPGWKVIFGASADKEAGDNEDKQTLPVLTAGQSVKCSKAEVESKKTTPPARFIEGTLIEAMVSIHQLVDDPDLKRRLKETSGIGTDATRAVIIETLKDRSFLVVKGKNLISTDAGRHLIQALPEQVKSPGLTGLFEQLLDAVATGLVPAEIFMTKAREFVVKYTALAKENPLVIGATHACPVCGEGHLRRRKNERGWFWGCNRFKDGGCKAIYDDKSGEPVLDNPGCPVCGSGKLHRRKSAHGVFWGCDRFKEGCKAIFDDKRGKPDLKKDSGPACPVCGSGHLCRRKSERGYFWGCDRYKEGCKAIFDDEKGKPNLKGKASSKKPA